MNFFGHAWLAARRAQACPAFVLGAMAPDLLAMAGRRAEARAAVGRAARGDGGGGLTRGVAFHAATDAAFHAAPTFAALQREAVGVLREAGVRRGHARGVAHVGLELLLDGWLVRAADAPEARAYREALREARRGDAAGLADVCRRLQASPLPEAYADPQEVARRVVAVLARRPRLALAAGERDAAASWVQGAARRVEADGGALLAEVERALGASRAAQPARSGAPGAPGGG